MAEERLQRRLAAILSADVVGYSRLMGLDEAGTLSRLNALRRGLIDPMIAAHAGRIVKLMGDGARHLVGKRHRDHLERFAFEKLCEPRIFLRLVARVSQHCAGSDHQNSSQIAIAPFRDRPELLFAASRVFARHEPDPGREGTTRSKNLRIRDGRCVRSVAMGG